MKTRYATKPPNCVTMQKANEKLWEKHPELKRRKLTMSPDEDEAKLRTEWMNNYSEFCGKDRNKYISTNNPHLKPGELTEYCKDKEEPGPWTNPVEVPRFIKEKMMDENGFEEVGIQTKSTSVIVNVFFNVTFYEIPFPTGIWQHIPLMRVKVEGIEVGETTWDFPSNTVTGTTRTSFARI